MGGAGAAGWFPDVYGEARTRRGGYPCSPESIEADRQAAAPAKAERARPLARGKGPGRPGRRPDEGVGEGDAPWL